MNVSTFSVSAILTVILAGPTVAADLGRAPPPAAMDPVVRSMWSGFHVGLNAGVGGGTTNYPIAATIGPVAIDGKGKMDASGRMIGAQIGYDWVFSSRILVGLEADIAWTDVEDRFALDGSATVNGVPIGSAGGNIGTKLDYLGTVRGRLGYVVTDPWLVYLTGGWAYGGVKSSYSAGISGIGGVAGSTTNFMSGWVAGVGTEYAITPDISFRAEYLHVDLGSADLFNLAAGGLAAGMRVEPAYDFVRAGINYRFASTAPATALQPAAFVSPTTFDWTGFHVGVNGGYAAARNEYPIDVGFTTGGNVVGIGGTGRLQGSGMLAGVQIGYDHQLSNKVVLGIEADIDWADVRGRLGIDGSAWNGGVPLGSAGGDIGTNLQYLGTVRARLGYAVTEPWLIYATGGWAYGETKSSAGASISGLGGIGVSKTLNHSGWVAGIGSEFAVTPNFTIRAEYLHVDFDSKTLWDFTAGTTRASLKLDPSYDLVRIGANYKFDFGAPAAMVAKY